jgi:hypothetical protein
MIAGHSPGYGEFDGLTLAISGKAVLKLAEGRPNVRPPDFEPVPGVYGLLQDAGLSSAGPVH